MFRLLARSPVLTATLNMTITPVTTAAWVEFIHSITKASTAVEIYNPSGSTLLISNGPAGQESNFVIPYSILPGGSSIFLPVDPYFKINGRISLKALDANATANIFVMNFFG